MPSARSSKRAAGDSPGRSKRARTTADSAPSPLASPPASAPRGSSADQMHADAAAGGTNAAAATPPADPLRRPHPAAGLSERFGIVQRRFYPPEMSNARARAYAAGSLERPIETLASALSETARRRGAVPAGSAVVHWFRADLRVHDNHALWLASEKAREAGVPLLGLYVLSPQDWEAHFTAPVRVDFILRTLAVLRDGLARLDIPLHVETVPLRAEVPARITSLLSEWRARHIFANMEYEVDELRREASLVRSLAARGDPVALDVVHDTCVVPPGELRSGSGNQYAVYTPWYRAWSRHLGADPKRLEAFGDPARNPGSARKEFHAFFDEEIPSAPESKRLAGGEDGEDGEDGEEKRARMRELWPAGEAEARRRLDEFCEKRAENYHSKRDLPAEDGTSSLSPYLACGAISARTCVRVADDADGSRGPDGGARGVQTWISEVAWRDFYRHVLVRWPHVCMNKPFKPEYSNVEWSYDDDHFRAWCEGRTGFPVVDAAVRQLRRVGWMHNRCRMVVASFLAKDLLLDWRMGERFFMENLIDGDFASNSGGWGFGAGVGVDPQPYFRVFNPLRQSERFDPEGEYIRRWVPELAGVAGKAVHDPYGRGAVDQAEENGYPRQIVDHADRRKRALDAYKKGIARVDDL